MMLDSFTHVHTAVMDSFGAVPELQETHSIFLPYLRQTYNAVTAWFNPPKHKEESAIVFEEQDLCDTCMECGITSFEPGWTSKTVDLSEAHLHVIERVLFRERPRETSSCPSCRLLSIRPRTLQIRPLKVGYGIKERSDQPSAPDLLECHVGLDFIESRVLGLRHRYTQFALASNMETGRSVLRRWDFVKPNPNYDFLRDRLRECREKHRKCRHNHTNRHHNIHVVNVRERIIQPLPIDAEYFALSYVWGSAMQNYSSSCRSVSRSLPRTIEDAMVVVKSLGLDYLWVDSLCINQSDSEEKLQQIRHMDSVYEAAFATIIVLDSSNADSGIFGVGQERVQAQMWADIGGHRVVARLPSLRDELDASHWAKRAWTLQEGQLSTRCLVFSKHQVHFFCNEHNHSEDATGISVGSSWSNWPSLVSPLRYYSSFQPTAIYDMIVGAYTGREMTKDEDVLNAVSGMLRRLEDKFTPHGLCFGLPVKNLTQTLLWKQKSPATTVNKDESLLADRRLPGRVPSWTWAGWKLVNSIEPGKDLWATDLEDEFDPPLYLSYHSAESFDSFARDFSVTFKWPNIATACDGTPPDCDELRQLQENLLGLYKLFKPGEPDQHDGVLKQSVEEPVLRVHGLVQTLPFSFMSNPGKHITVELQSEVDVFGDFHDQDTAQDRTSSRAIDVLWLAVRLDNVMGLELEGVLLHWEANVAYRAGVFRLEMDESDALLLLDRCTPAFRTFWFG